MTEISGLEDWIKGSWGQVWLKNINFLDPGSS